MERQKSFSFKSTRFLLFYFTIFSSLLFLSFFSVWLVKSTPTVPQQPDLLYLNTSSPPLYLDLKPTASASLENSSASTFQNQNLIHTHLIKPENASGFSTIKDQVPENGDKVEDGAGIKFTAISESESRSSPHEINLLGSEMSKENAYGFSTIKDQVPENGEKVEDGAGKNFTATSESESRSSPHEINLLSSEMSEEKRTRATSLEKIQVQSSKSIVEKKTGASAHNKFGMSDGKIEEHKVKACNVAKGSWVYDESYPQYTNSSCPFIDEGFNCLSNGRLDKRYMKLRWQPQDCDIPRFNATKMLELIRGKRLVFVGDSINRNQWESMLCLLMGAIKNPKKVYETHGRRITKEKGNYSFKFVDYGCTVEYYVTHFLVHESKARIGKKRVPTLRIDAIDRGSSRWRGADILVFNTAHWWSHYKTKSGINYYQERDQVHSHLDVSTAFRKALTTWASWVDKRINSGKTKVFFRSSAPSHFRGGQWNSGGHCREATNPL